MRIQSRSGASPARRQGITFLRPWSSPDEHRADCTERPAHPGRGRRPALRGPENGQPLGHGGQDPIHSHPRRAPALPAVGDHGDDRGQRPEPLTEQPVVAAAASAPVPQPDREDAGRADQIAAGLVAEAVSVAMRAQADHASADLVAASAAVVAAARRTAAAARRSREGRAQAAEQAAEAIADHAFRTATDLKLRAEAAARQLNQAALEAAALVVSANHKGHEQEDAAAALQVAEHVKAAAVSVAEDSAEAAVRLADAVTAAAAAVASTVSATDRAIEGEVAKVAAALQFAAAAQARHVAAETDARASATAIVARDAARAVRRRDLEAGTNRSPDSNHEVSGATPVLVRF